MKHTSDNTCDFGAYILKSSTLYVSVIHISGKEKSKQNIP